MFGKIQAMSIPTAHFRKSETLASCGAQLGPEVANEKPAPIVNCRGCLKKREEAAYHEAGHAVVTVLFRAHLGYVQVIGIAGHTGSHTDTPEQVIHIAMAGPAAEYMYCHPDAQGFTLANCNASNEDLAYVDSYCGSYPPEQRQHLREQHWASTCQMLKSKWSVVQELARKIVDDSVVSGTVVVDLLAAGGRF